MSFFSEAVQIVERGTTQQAHKIPVVPGRGAMLQHGDKARFAQISENLSKIGLDLAALLDPTGAVSLGMAVMHAYQGNLAAAGFDLLGAAPIAGKGVKLLQIARNMPRYLASVREAIRFSAYLRAKGPAGAQMSNLLTALLQPVYQLAVTLKLHMLPRVEAVITRYGASAHELRAIREALDALLAALRPAVLHSNGKVEQAARQAINHIW